jgi:hypothetical protein
MFLTGKGYHSRAGPGTIPPDPVRRATPERLGGASGSPREAGTPHAPALQSPARRGVGSHWDAGAFVPAVRPERRERRACSTWDGTYGWILLESVFAPVEPRLHLPLEPAFRSVRNAGSWLTIQLASGRSYRRRPPKTAHSTTSRCRIGRGSGCPRTRFHRCRSEDRESRRAARFVVVRNPRTSAARGIRRARAQRERRRKGTPERVG